MFKQQTSPIKTIMQSDIKKDQVPNEHKLTQAEMEDLIDQDLDEEWETEMREEEKNIEKEMQRKAYESNGINLYKRFIFALILSGTLIVAAFIIKLSRQNMILGPNDDVGVGIPNTEIRYTIREDGKEVERFEFMKVTTILFAAALIPATYFASSVMACLIKYGLGRKKENTRLLVFYFSKMEGYFVIALTGLLTMSNLNIFLAIWQPLHFAAFYTDAASPSSQYIRMIFTGVKFVMAWGGIHLLFIIIFRSFSIKFHKSAYYDRVLQALFTEYILVMLSRPISTPKKRKNSKDSSSLDSGATLMQDAWDNVKIEKVPIKEKEIVTRHVSNMRLAEFVTFLQDSPYFLVHSAEHSEESLRDISKNVFGLLTSPKQSKSTFKNQSRALSARKLGQRLFHYLKDDNKDHITVQDFEKQLPKSLSDDAFRIFDKNFDGSLDYREFISTVNEILKERKAISDSLNDAEKALSKLESVFFAIACFFWFFIALHLNGQEVQSTFVSLTSFIVGFAFLFGPVVKSIVDGIVFVFISHPFDISDRILLPSGSDAPPVMYTVMRLNMYNTVFKRADNAIVVFPNSTLATMSITNLTKSPQMVDIVKFNINADTPVAKLRKLEKLIKRFLMHNPQHYNDTFEMSMNKCQNCLEIDVRINHRHNFHNMKRYRERRTNAIYELMQIVEHLGIQNEELTRPIRKLNE